MKNENNNVSSNTDDSKKIEEKEKGSDEKKKVNKKKKTEKDIEDILFNVKGKFLHVKVGTEKNPAQPEDIEDIRQKIDSLIEKNKLGCVAFVTHHAISIDVL